MTAGLKQIIKRAAFALVPGTATAVVSARARAHSHTCVENWGLGALNRRLVESLGPVVRSGPFAGMTLSPMCFKEHIGPFLLGTYEGGVHPWFEEILSKPYRQVLDVGAKFGYYAVGIARQMPTTPVIAFDTDWWARAATREMASVNGASNVTVRGYCSPRWLDRHLIPSSFVLSDCEGFEGELFSQAKTPALRSATLLIEVHDNLLPGVSTRVKRRFAETHTVSSVTNAPVHMPGPELGFLSTAEAESAVSEIRGPQQWLLLRPNASA